MKSLFLLLTFFLIPMIAQDQSTQRLVEIGNQASVELMTNLKSALMDAMKKGGPANAIEVCNKKALELTQQIANKNENVLSIRRTTFKYRNPLNKPDSLETEALKYFEEHIENLPDYYLQVENGKDGKVYNFYKPMKVAGLCIGCHGKEDVLSDKVRNVLAELYPDDKATGYEPGDFRGVIKVTIK